jgi:hypothetical protein
MECVMWKCMLVCVIGAVVIGCAAAPRTGYEVVGPCPYCTITDLETGRWYKGDLQHECRGNQANFYAWLFCKSPVDEQLLGSGADASHLWAPGWDRTPKPAYPDINAWGRDGHLTTGRYDPALNRYTIRSYGR